MSFDQFANMNPQQVYAQLSPQQRSAVAQQFIQDFQRSGAPEARQWGNLDPNNVGPDQLAQMHRRASQNHPGVLGEVMRHPVVTAALGGFAAYELDKDLGQHQQHG
jgi:hypothetical protein